MKKSGTLNTHLSRVIASMGHTHGLVVGDAGLPMPRGKDVVDLALAKNIPSFLETVRVILEELQVESAVVASEMKERSNGTYEKLREMLGDIEVTEVPHDEFKRLTCQDETIALVRTGEATPFANVILISGVTFG